MFVLPADITRHTCTCRLCSTYPLPLHPSHPAAAELRHPSQRWPHPFPGCSSSHVGSVRIHQRITQKMVSQRTDIGSTFHTKTEMNLDTEHVHSLTDHRDSNSLLITEMSPWRFYLLFEQEKKQLKPDTEIFKSKKSFSPSVWFVEKVSATWMFCC